MLFTRLMGMISLGIGLAFLIAFLQVRLSREDLFLVWVWLKWVSCCIPPIFAGLDLIFGKSLAPADQLAVLHRETEDSELGCSIDLETPPGAPPC